MELKRNICPSCGATVNIHEEQDFTFCTYCGSRVMKEKSFKKFEIEITSSLKTLLGAHPNVEIYVDETVVGRLINKKPTIITVDSNKDHYIHAEMTYNMLKVKSNVLFIEKDYTSPKLYVDIYYEKLSIKMEISKNEKQSNEVVEKNNSSISDKVGNFFNKFKKDN